VVIEDKVYQVNLPGEAATGRNLSQDNEIWLNSDVSWSPDGLRVAYTVSQTHHSALRLYEPPTQHYETLGFDSDSAIAPAWSAACATGLGTTCEIGYKMVMTQSEISPTLVAYNPTTQRRREWQISAEPIVELRWSPDNRLFYRRPSRDFYAAENHETAFELPKGATLGNVSPDLAEMVYYQTFTLSDCQGGQDKCLYLGLWLTKYGQNNATQRQLIYNANMVQPVEGLNYIPTWSAHNFVFFQEGNLVYYDQDKNEAAIYTKSLYGKLRSSPIFAPTGEAVAFVDNQGNGVSNYRLMIINPRLQPIEKMIVTDKGFQILAWLPF
jgi:Tol biopolymer transport system component